MKKILILILLFVATFSLTLTQIKAEEIVEDETQVVEEEETEIVDEVKEWFNEFFAPEKIALYITWLSYIGVIIGLVANANKLRQKNHLTLKNVSDEVRGILATTISGEVESRFNQFLPSIIETQKKTNDSLTIFAKILTLSQENTPESKVAILKLIEELGVVSKQIVDNSKAIIEEGVKIVKEKQEQLDSNLDKIIEDFDGTSI